MFLLRDIFSPELFEKYRNEELEKLYNDFQKKARDLKRDGHWEELENLEYRIFGHDVDKKHLFVFLSHSHKNLKYTMNLISFLRKKYNVFVYIDSEDKTLPLKTSIRTAQVIKKKIEKCDRFIFLASKGAIISKWCNWELGIGDTLKFPYDKLAFLAWRDTNLAYRNYTGNEYMEIYPFIVYTDGCGHDCCCVDEYFDKEDVFDDEMEFNSGLKSMNVPRQRGWYVRFKKGNTFVYKPLKEWLS